MDRTDPRAAAAESVALRQFLDYQRATLLLKTDGLDAEQLNRTLPPSSLTLGGLLKHLAFVEDHWIQVRFLGRELTDLEVWGTVDWDADGDWEFHSAPHDSPAYLRELYHAACERSRRATDDTVLDALAAGVDRSGEHWSLRWVLLHLIEETARHLGHADFIRDSIDGTVGE